MKGMDVHPIQFDQHLKLHIRKKDVDVSKICFIFIMGAYVFKRGMVNFLMKLWCVNFKYNPLSIYFVYYNYYNYNLFLHNKG